MNHLNLDEMVLQNWLPLQLMQIYGNIVRPIAVHNSECWKISKYNEYSLILREIIMVTSQMTAWLFDIGLH